MVIASEQSKALLGRSSKWPLLAVFAAVLLVTAFLIGYWSWLEEMREKIITGALLTVLSASVVLVFLRVVTVVALAVMMVRVLFEPAGPEAAPVHDPGNTQER